MEAQLSMDRIKEQKKLIIQNRQEQQAEEGNKKIEGAKSNQLQGNNVNQIEQETHTSKQVEGTSGNQIDQANEAYHNFSRYDHNPQVDRFNKQGGQVNHATARQSPNQQQGQQPKNNATPDHDSEPAPYTVVHSLELGEDTTKPKMKSLLALMNVFTQLDKDSLLS